MRLRVRGKEVSNLGQEDVRNYLGSGCRVRISGVQALEFLHYHQLGDWDWRGVPGCGKGPTTFTCPGKCGNLADTTLSAHGSSSCGST